MILVFCFDTVMSDCCYGNHSVVSCVITNTPKCTRWWYIERIIIPDTSQHCQNIFHIKVGEQAGWKQARSCETTREGFFLNCMLYAFI